MVVWSEFKIRLCKLESRQTIHYFMQVPFKYKFRCSIQDIVESSLPHPIINESQKTKITYFQIIWPSWLLINYWLFGQTVDQSQLIVLYSIYFMSELQHHVRVFFNTISRVGPAKIYQKAYTMSRGPNMQQKSEKEKNTFLRM